LLTGGHLPAIRYVPNQSQRSNDHVTQVLGLEFVEPVTMEEHCRYKYLLNFDGQAASFRLKTLFLCGAVVLMVDPVWDEFWYGMLVPFVHYVPLAADGSDADATLDFLEAHQDWAEAIAENGRQFVLQRLRMEDVQGYWDDLLTRYSMLQSYEPAIDTALATVVGPAAGARAEL
jgi:protein glucosyltransferase